MTYSDNTALRSEMQDAETTYPEKNVRGGGYKLNVEKMSFRRLSAIRRAQLRKVARYRVGTEDGCDVLAFAKAFAMILNESPEGPYKFKTSKTVTFLRWPGLDIYSLRTELRDLELDFDDAILHEALDYAHYRFRQISSIIELTIEERKMCSAWNLGICEGETARSRKINNRKNSNMQKIRVAREHGVTPRAEYEAKSNESLKPWLADGISRPTWYRRRKAQKQKDIETTNETCNYDPDTGRADTLITTRVRSEPVSQSKKSAKERGSTSPFGIKTAVKGVKFILARVLKPSNDNFMRMIGLETRDYGGENSHGRIGI